jgi:CRP-like cAMP-binding protein
MPTATAEDLAGVALFDTLEADERAAIAPWFELRDVSAGVRLTGEGASGYSFFVLRRGAADVSIDGSDVRTLGPGDFFGELATGVGRRPSRPPRQRRCSCCSAPSSGGSSRSIPSSRPGSSRSSARRLRPHSSR